MIIPKEVKNKKNISDIIIQNLYCILNNNEYYALLNFFMFKELIIAHGRYGTVFFGIDIKNARPIAIKVSNEKKRNIFLSTEIEIIKNLSKYKIFTQVYDEMKLLDKIFIFETLQGPDLSKIKKIYGALCYLMIDLYCGELPLDGISSENDKYKRVIKLKEKYNPKKSNSNCAKKYLLFMMR